jgi:5-methylcytosine-specific restriction enzyme subunit McrC
LEFLTLLEHGTAKEVLLTAEQRDALRRLVPSITVVPTAGRESTYDLTPGSVIGAVALPGMAIEIRPKIEIDRVLFLLSYALNPRAWRPDRFLFEARPSLVEALIPGFVHQVRHAFRRGLLQGYRSDEDALQTVRGRIRIDDQLRRRFGLVPPVEVRFDELTEDIEVNRLIRAAVDRLERMPVRFDDSRAALRRIRGALERVALKEYAPAQLPEIAWDRLNEHYRGAVELAKLVLRSTSFDLRHGVVRASAFLVDMNEVFETFAAEALREALGLTSHAFPRGACGRNLWLDHARAVRLEPDLSWWEGSVCVFVGDLKYKRVDVRGIKNSDLYQLLAYTVATGLSTGLLIYAAGEGEPAAHEIVEIGKRLEVVTLDLSRGPRALLAQIAELAESVRRMRRSPVESRAGSWSSKGLPT